MKDDKRFLFIKNDSRLKDLYLPVFKLCHQGKVPRVVLHRLLQAVLDLVTETPRLLGAYPPQVLALGVVHVAQVVESATLPNLRE